MWFFKAKIKTSIEAAFALYISHFSPSKSTNVRNGVFHSPLSLKALAELKSTGHFDLDVNQCLLHGAWKLSFFKTLNHLGQS